MGSSSGAGQVAVAGLTARLTYNGVVLREVAVGRDGVAVFDGVDFNQEPGHYRLDVELTPWSSSVLSSQVNRSSM